VVTTAGAATQPQRKRSPQVFASSAPMVITCEQHTEPCDCTGDCGWSTTSGSCVAVTESQTSCEGCPSLSVCSNQSSKKTPGLNGMDTHTHTQTHTYDYVHAPAHEYMHAHTPGRTHESTQRMYMHVYTYAHIHKYTHTYTHTHTHTNTHTVHTQTHTNTHKRTEK
jgi:hypothetical protein